MENADGGMQTVVCDFMYLSSTLHLKKRRVINMVKYSRFTATVVFVAVCACVSHAEHLKVDISTTGQSRGHAPDFTQWILPINCGSTQTATFGSVTVRLDMTSPPADATHYLKCQYANKDGQTYNFKLSYDGIWPHWKDDAVSADMPYPNGGATKEIINCIFADNTIGLDASGVAIFNYADGYDDATILENNLFFSNSGLDPLDPTGANIIGANGNIAGDPLFADAANGDYHLKAGSAGEDAGRALAVVLDDFAGTARPVGAAYDIGAFEGQDIRFYNIRNIIATASSSVNADFGPENTVDESGLNALDQHDTTPTNMWLSSAGQEPPVWIEYEFDIVYKLDQMWVWNSNSALEPIAGLGGLGVKTATIQYSTDGAKWTALADVPEFAQAPGADDYASNTTVDFDGVAAKFVRITCTSSWGGGNQCSLSEVRFSYIPVTAEDPYPANGAAGVSPDVTLGWTAGREAALHEIHLGTDVQAVADSTTPVDTVSQATYAPNLQPDTTYYWRVVEVNDAESPSAWSSPVWSFSTAQYVVVDDFESYGQLSPNKVYQTWVDGLGFSADKYFPDGYSGNGTGAIIGHDPAVGPIMEYTIVHGGHRSMPLSYDGPSETTRTFQPARDWTRGAVETLVLFFLGESTNVSGELYVKINGVEVPYSGSAGDLTAAEWKQWNIDLPAAAGLGAVGTLTIGISGGQGILYIDDIGLYRSAPAVNPQPGLRFGRR